MAIIIIVIIIVIIIIVVVVVVPVAVATTARGLPPGRRGFIRGCSTPLGPDRTFQLGSRL
jgi:hypothetical protein